MKRIIAFLMVVVTAFSLMSFCASAAGAKPWKSDSMVGKSGGYNQQFNYTRIDQQKMCEKAITVKKGKTAYIVADVDIYAKASASSLTKYVRFALWIYDVKTNQRVVNTTIQPGQKYRLPVDSKSGHTYSVQIRPYMHTSVWNNYARNRSTVNDFLQRNGFHLSW